MELTSAISQNKNLLFIDAVNGKTYGFDEIIKFHKIRSNTTKKLAFVYAENNIEDIAAFFVLYHSNYCIALLNPKLALDFKLELENSYNPYCVYDTTRENIAGFLKENNFFYNDLSNIILHTDVKLLLATSGSTGSPKFVKLSNNNILSNAESILDYLPINSKDTVPLNLPFYYSFGLSVLTTNAIAGGKILVNCGEIMQRDFWNHFSSYSCTSLAGVPYVYEMLYRTGFTKKSYPSLRYLLQAGGKLPIKYLELFADYCGQNKIDFFIMYGQTEATARMSYLPPSKLAHKKGSVGKAIKNGEFLLNIESNELLYKGPNVFGGYANSADELQHFEQPSYLATGDVAEIDNEGYVYITGRLKRIVKITGNRINLDEIEQRLRETFPGAAFAAVGLEDTHLMVFFTNLTIDTSAITEYLRTAIAMHPAFIKTRFIDEIPLNANGKPDYGKLSEFQ